MWREPQSMASFLGLAMDAGTEPQPYRQPRLNLAGESLSGPRSAAPADIEFRPLAMTTGSIAATAFGGLRMRKSHVALNR